MSGPISSDCGWNILQIRFPPGPKIHPVISRKVISDKRHPYTHRSLGCVKPYPFLVFYSKAQWKQLFLFCACTLYFRKPEQQCLSPTVVHAHFYSFFFLQPRHSCGKTLNLTYEFWSRCLNLTDQDKYN